ncbi:TraR/DksA C4-type zinc finger protein [Oceanobacillus sojae]|uniref:TraR/DksA C4-type zinc finger protein n=1 Tax=Oceanobacillus sojae TaxID=582851 RepID=UPI000988691A|nr:TraR/DksA C4-type zinc finger protein [Oceanobacillus sojae]MCT1902824.1 TraR/DksA C4-type zinc finger protein [Oceanobacillus sojae]
MKININQLKKRILARQEELIEKINQETEAIYEFSQEVSGELSNYDNHPADTGTELFDKERDSALRRLAESELEEINNSLHAMEEGTYGICKVCGGNIDPERLEALPTADCCVEHAEKPAYHGDTPPKEVFKGRDDGGENSWEDVRQYGTSSSSIEYAGNFNEFGDEEEKEIDPEDFLAADIEGKYTGVMPNHEAYEQRIDDEE